MSQRKLTRIGDNLWNCWQKGDDDDDRDEWIHSFIYSTYHQSIRRRTVRGMKEWKYVRELERALQESRSNLDFKLQFLRVPRGRDGVWWIRKRGTKEGKLGGAPGAIQKISIVPHNKYGNYFKFLVILLFDSGKEEAHIKLQLDRFMQVKPYGLKVFEYI